MRFNNSFYWITKGILRRLFGGTIRICESETGCWVIVCTRAPRFKKLLFNIAQTTDFPRVKAFADDLAKALIASRGPMDFLSNYEYQGCAQAQLLVDAFRRGLRSSLWLTLEDLETVSSRMCANSSEVPKLQNNAVGTTVTHFIHLKQSWQYLASKLDPSPYLKSLSKVTLFNIDEVENGATLLKLHPSLKSFDILTGRFVDLSCEKALHTHAAQLFLQGNVWIPYKAIVHGNFGQHLRFMHDPIILGGKKQGIRDHRRSDIYYHLEQCLESAQMLRRAIRGPAIELIRRAAFDAEYQSKLHEFADAHSFSSNLFFGESDLQFLYKKEVFIPNKEQQPFATIERDNCLEKIYNAEQSSDPIALTQYIRAEPSMSNGASCEEYQGIVLARLQYWGRLNKFQSTYWMTHLDICKIQPGWEIHRDAVALSIPASICGKSAEGHHFIQFYNYEQITKKIT